MSDANSLPTGGPSESGRGGGRLAVPDTLNGQLLLLAYDRRRNRVDGDDRWRFGLALHTAMLTDLYMAGHLHDEDGSLCSGRTAPVPMIRSCGPHSTLYAPPSRRTG